MKYIITYILLLITTTLNAQCQCDNVNCIYDPQNIVLTSSTIDYDLGDTHINISVGFPGIATPYSTQVFNNENFWVHPLGGLTSIVGEYFFGVTLTVNFSDSLGHPKTVSNPILHLDRVGGRDNNIQNSGRFTLQSGTWSKLSGSSDFFVTSNYLHDAGAGTPTGPVYSFESGADDENSTSSGSVILNGSMSSFAIQITQEGPAGTGTDAVELLISLCE